MEEFYVPSNVMMTFWQIFHKYKGFDNFVLNAKLSRSSITSNHRKTGVNVVALVNRF